MPKAPKGQNGPLPKIVVQKELALDDGVELLITLQARFENHKHRHKGLEWAKIHQKLQANRKKLISLYAMESTGGEPDVVGQDSKTGEYIFIDCSPESPTGRRSICFDAPAEAMRVKKGIFPAGNAQQLADAMGIEILTEAQYRNFQKLEEFDLKTSSWIATPEKIRDLGGALFCDRRYDTVFLYHNGADSFYGARGFRGMLKL